MSNKSQKGNQMKQTIYNKYKLQGKGNYDNYYIDTTDAATLIMKELKSVFPNVTFQKQTQKYSGGSSVNIYLADSFEFMKKVCDSNVYPGITNNELANKIVNKYSKGFDGMIDMAYSSEYILTKNDEVYKVSCKGTQNAGGSVPKKTYNYESFPDVDTAIPVSIYCYCFYNSIPKYGSKAYELYKQTNQQEAA